MEAKTQHPKQAPGIRLLRLGSEVVLCDTDGAQRCALNETAAALWELCDGKTSPTEIIDAVCEICAVDKQIAKFDVERMLGVFGNRGLIEWT